MTAAAAGAGLAETAADDAAGAPLPAVADAEACLIGALLHVDHRRAAGVLARVTDDDCDDPRARLALALVRTVHTAGARADPAAVLDAATRTGRAGTDDGRRGLGRYLAEVFTAVPHPGNVERYADAVLAQSFRRTMSRFGDQCRQYAETGSLADALHVLRTGPETLRTLYARMTAPPGKEDRRG